MSSTSVLYSSSCKLQLMIICPTKGTNGNTNLGPKHLESGICVFIQCQRRLHQYIPFTMYAPINAYLSYPRHKYEYQPGLEASPVWYLCIHTTPVSSASGICSSPCTLSLMIICRTKDTNTNTNLGISSLVSVYSYNASIVCIKYIRTVHQVPGHK